jgi:hypothetical protein
MLAGWHSGAFHVRRSFAASEAAVARELRGHPGGPGFYGALVQMQRRHYRLAPHIPVVTE